MLIPRFVLGVCCALAFSIIPSALPREPLRYEVAARLDIPHASNLAWSPDGTRLAVTSWPTIQIWDTETWELLQTIPDAYVYNIAWSPSGDRIAGAGGGYTENVYIWNPQTGELLEKLSSPPLPDGNSASIVVRALAWSPDGRRIITDGGIENVNLRLWDFDSEDNPQPWVVWHEGMSHDDWIDIASLTWSQNGQWLLGNGSDGNFQSRSIIRLWDAATGDTIRTIFPGFAPMWGKDDRQFAGLSQQNSEYVINVWDTETGDVLATYYVGGTGMNSLAWNTDANVIAGERVFEPVAIWDIDAGKRYDLEALDTPSPRDVQWRPHSNQLAVADYDQGVYILDFDFGG